MQRIEAREPSYNAIEPHKAAWLGVRRVRRFLSMFGERPVADAVRFVRALATNQYARVAPLRYLQWRGETGRGSGRESVDDIATYFWTSFFEYFEKLGVPEAEIGSFLSGRRCLEYGPGDVPGVALLMYAHGAEKIYCVDRFPLIRWSQRNLAVMRSLLDRLAPEKRERGMAALKPGGTEAFALDTERIQYLVHPSGLSGLAGEIGLVYSRAVLEYVDDLRVVFNDMDRALVPGGMCIHQVDLRSHGLHRRNSLDFLTWPEPLWHAMYSEKGIPNRCRIDRYRDALSATSLSIEQLEPLERASDDVVQEVRPHLARPFQAVSDSDLAWLRFWLIARRGSP